MIGVYVIYNICRFTFSVCCYRSILYYMQRISCVLLACSMDTISKRLRRWCEIVKNLVYFPENTPKPNRKNESKLWWPMF